MTYSYFHPSNRHMIALFRLLGDGVLRIGGGSVDQVMWTTAAAGTHLQVTPVEIKALAGFLEATGWPCIYGVNFATSTPAQAAEEVAYAASVLGSNLLGIEIGNEPDEYGIPGNFFAGNWSFEDYLARWDVFRSAILQSAPKVAITGPAVAGGNHINSWTLPFGQETTAAEITLLTQHYYRDFYSNGGSPTAAFLVSPDSQLTGELAILNAGAQQLDIPYRIDECNSFDNGGVPGVSNSYASSLWVIDYLFDVALGRAAGVNLHGGGRSPGYTPIADDDGGVVEARPEYYGLLLFALAGQGTLLETQLLGGHCRCHGLCSENRERRPEPGCGEQRHATEYDPYHRNQPKHSVSDAANDDRGESGGDFRSYHPGRHGEPGRQLLSSQSGHTYTGGYANDLLHPGTDRGADQH